MKMLYVHWLDWILISLNRVECVDARWISQSSIRCIVLLCASDQLLNTSYTCYKCIKVCVYVLMWPLYCIAKASKVLHFNGFRQNAQHVAFQLARTQQRRKKTTFLHFVHQSNACELASEHTNVNCTSYI